MAPFVLPAIPLAVKAGAALVGTGLLANEIKKAGQNRQIANILENLGSLVVCTQKITPATQATTATMKVNHSFRFPILTELAIIISPILSKTDYTLSFPKSQ